MASVSYSWVTDVPGLTLNLATTGNQADVAVAATAGGGYLGAWSVGSASVRGRYVAADGTRGLEDPLNITAQGNQFDASMALLGNGHNVVTFTDDSSGTDTVRIRILGENAVGNDVDFAVPADTRPLRESDVTALGSGGFAVAYTRDYGGGDTDVFVQRYEADGDTIGGVITVDSAAALGTDHASIAGLASGGFVVAWEQSAKAGGDHSVWFQLYDTAGTRVTVAGDPANTHHLIDDIGSINQDIQVAALQDGGFVVAYVDNGGAGVDGTEIAARVYNADGTARSDYLRVNEDTDDAQVHPTLTVLSNGYFAVGWVSGSAFYYQAYDSTGTAVGSNFSALAGVIEAEIAALADGRIANVRESTVTDGDGNSVRSSVNALVRTTTGTAAAETLAGDGLRDVMDGAGNNDILDGFGAADDLFGGAGDDTLRGGAGADKLDGGIGIDTASYYTGSVGVLVNLETGTGIGGDAHGDSLAGIENISGSQGNDDLTGTSGANKLQGWDGNDVLRGGAGADVLEGGAGIDIATYFLSVAGVTVDLAAGTGSGGYAAGDTLSGVENVQGGQGNNSLTGNGVANKLSGWIGDDVLRGGGGADTLEGGLGVDTASYFTSAAGVTVDLGAGTASGGDAAGDVLSGIEVLSGSNTGNDILTGDAGANKLQGWGGDDVLRGGAGADVLEGGAGIDTASYYTGMAGISVSLATGTGGGGDAAGDMLSGIENLSGSQGSDSLAGNAGANVLQGWNGDDGLFGGAGKDTLTGGAGADRHHFLTLGDSVVGANADLITDFSHAQADRIDLEEIDANAGVANDQAFSFIGANLYTGAAGQLRYSIVHGVTTIAGDVNGDKVSDFHIILTGSIVLVAADFLL